MRNSSPATSGRAWVWPRTPYPHTHLPIGNGTGSHHSPRCLSPSSAGPIHLDYRIFQMSSLCSAWLRRTKSKRAPVLLLQRVPLTPTRAEPLVRCVSVAFGYAHGEDNVLAFVSKPQRAVWALTVLARLLSHPDPLARHKASQGLPGEGLPFGL